NWYRARYSPRPQGGRTMRRLLFGLGILAVLPLAAAAGPAAPGQKEEKKAKAAPAHVAVFRLAAAVTESPEDDLFAFGGPAPGSLKDLVARLNKAADDPAVKAVVLLPEGGSLGLAQTEEVRQVMKRLRDAGKDVYAHADSLSMRQYALVAGASRLSVVPTADLWVMGIAGEAPYLR